MAIVLSPPRIVMLCALLLAASLPLGGASAQQRVGVNTAVNPDATGTPPGASARRLVLGQEVVYNERIQTQAKGQTQILFVDQSSMSVGPDSDLVIDQFVYNPNTGTGKMVASLTRGVFRFVGGELSKHDNAVTMRTPSATIGIRGGVFLLRLQPPCGGAAAAGCGKLDVIFEYGKSLTVTGLNGQTQTITRPGFQITVAQAGAPPSPPSPAPPGSQATILRELDGQPGQSGGSSNVPTDQTVANSGLSTTLAATTTTIAPPVQTQALGARDSSQIQNSTSTGAVGCTSTGNCTQVAGGASGGGPPVNPGPLTTPGAFALAPDAALQSAIPFIRNGAGGNSPDPTVSPLLLATPPNADFAGTAAARTKALQASLAIDGQGAAQSSVLVVAVGNTLNSATGQAALSGQVEGSFRANGGSNPVQVSAALATATDAAGNSFFGSNGTISSFTVQNSGAATETSYPGAQTAGYGFAQPAVPTALPAGVGTQHTTRTQTGYFGGVMQSFTANGAGTPYAVTGAASVATDASTYQVQANFSGRDPFTPATSGVNQLGVSFGTTAPGITRARQAYIDDSHFAALESPLIPSQVNQVALTGGGGDPLQGAHVYMVTGNAAPATGLLPDGTPCQCQFLQWGYWGGSLNTGTAAGADASRVDVAHINTWVAGVPTATGDIQSLAAGNVTGTYNGNLIGSVVNNGAQYVASGGLQATYNFGSQTGTFAVSNYDGRSFAAPIPAGSRSGANYTFAVNQGGLSGTVNGSFYGPMAAETGGNFALHIGPAYTTSGIFAAKR